MTITLDEGGYAATYQADLTLLRLFRRDTCYILRAVIDRLAMRVRARCEMDKAADTAGGQP